MRESVGLIPNAPGRYEACRIALGRFSRCRPELTASTSDLCTQNAYSVHRQLSGAFILVNRRPCMHNLSLAARVKVQLIAELLHKSSHEVEIISQGALEPRTPGGAPRSRFYPAFSEEQTFHPDIPVHYLSALDVRYLTGFGIQPRQIVSASATPDQAI